MSETACPKCGFVSDAAAEECGRCGIIFAKCDMVQKNKEAIGNRQCHEVDYQVPGDDMQIVEGLFLASLGGRGLVLLQSLPLSRLADRIVKHTPSTGGSRKGEGSILGGLGGLLDGDR